MIRFLAHSRSAVSDKMRAKHHTPLKLVIIILTTGNYSQYLVVSSQCHLRILQQLFSKRQYDFLAKETNLFVLVRDWCVICFMTKFWDWLFVLFMDLQTYSTHAFLRKCISVPEIMRAGVQGIHLTLQKTSQVVHVYKSFENLIHVATCATIVSGCLGVHLLSNTGDARL